MKGQLIVYFIVSITNLLQGIVMSEMALLITLPGSCGPLLPREFPLFY